jgi:hypothetical protein
VAYLWDVLTAALMLVLPVVYLWVDGWCDRRDG